jgi:hypothetical protein
VKKRARLRKRCLSCHYLDWRFPSATAAHNTAAAQDAPNPSQGLSDHRRRLRLPRVLLYMREVGPQLPDPVGNLDPLVEVVCPLPPALGLRISTKARPNALRGRWPSTLPKVAAAIGSWAFRVLMSSSDPRKLTLTTCGPPKDVLLLGRRAFADLIDSIKLGIGRHGINVKL